MFPSHPQPTHVSPPHSAQILGSIQFIYTQLSCQPCSLSVCDIQVSTRPLRAQTGQVRDYHSAQECRSSHLSLFSRLVEPEGSHWVWAALPWEPGAGITAAPPNQNRSRAELCRNWQGVVGFVLGRGGVHDRAWKEPTVRMRRWFRASLRRAFVHEKTCTFLGGKPAGSPILQASRASPVPCKLYGTAANMQQEFEELLGL